MSGARSALIIGGGFIGRAAAARLAHAGWAVEQVTRAPTSPLPGVARRAIDYRAAEVSSLLAGKDVLIFATGEMIPAMLPADLAQAYVEQVAPVIELAERAQRAGVARMVFVSSGGTVYGPAAPVPTDEDAATHPANVYGFLKLQTEHALRFVATRSGLSIVNLRVANPYGTGQRTDRPLGFVTAVLDRALRGEEVAIWGDGTATRDFIHIDDVARAIEAAACGEGTADVINIGSGVETSLNAVCALVAEATGVEVRRTHFPPRPVDVARSVLAIARAERELGWRPSIALRDGIVRMVAEQASARCDRRM